jgi:hypothetical protein
MPLVGVHLHLQVTANEDLPIAQGAAWPSFSLPSQSELLQRTSKVLGTSFSG